MISEQEIIRAVGKPVFLRGENYFKRAKVLSLHAEAPNRFKSLVSGIGRNIYRQSVTVVYSPGGGLARLKGECSCPVGFNCKHVVAALLHASGGLSPDIPPGGAEREPLSVHVEPELRENAERILSGVGLFVADAINEFYRQVVFHNGLPFSEATREKDRRPARKQKKTFTSYDPPGICAGW